VMRIRSLKQLRREIEKGIRDLDRGRAVVFSRAVAESIGAQGRRKLRKKR